LVFIMREEIQPTIAPNTIQRIIPIVIVC
jgi:hypothetical protein